MKLTHPRGIAAQNASRHKVFEQANQSRHVLHITSVRETQQVNKHIFSIMENPYSLTHKVRYIQPSKDVTDVHVQDIACTYNYTRAHPSMSGA